MTKEPEKIVGLLEFKQKLQLPEKTVRTEYFFKDEIAKEYMVDFPKRLAACETDDERKQLSLELRAVLGTYSLLVYYLYPYSEEFQLKIADSEELSRNFKMVKEWLDGHGGKEEAAAIAENMQKNSAPLFKDMQDLVCELGESAGLD
jgi:hypothetical protein